METLQNVLGNHRTGEAAWTGLFGSQGGSGLLWYVQSMTNAYHSRGIQFHYKPNPGPEEGTPIKRQFCLRCQYPSGRPVPISFETFVDLCSTDGLGRQPLRSYTLVGLTLDIEVEEKDELRREYWAVKVTYIPVLL